MEGKLARKRLFIFGMILFTLVVWFKHHRAHCENIDYLSEFSVDLYGAKCNYFTNNCVLTLTAPENNPAAEILLEQFIEAYTTNVLNRHTRSIHDIYGIFCSYKVDTVFIMRINQKWNSPKSPQGLSPRITVTPV